MEAGKRTIYEIFNGGRILEIPFFQRSYVWGETQWARLLEDVEDVTRTGNLYFIGPVILKQKQTETSTTVGDIRIVIDGQQRLTTLSIMLKVLCLKTDDMDAFNRQFRLRDRRTAIMHNHNDIDAYNEIMNLESIESVERNDKITSAYQYFVDNLDAEKVDFDTVCHSLMIDVCRD